MVEQVMFQQQEQLFIMEDMAVVRLVRTARSMAPMDMAAVELKPLEEQVLLEALAILV